MFNKKISSVLLGGALLLAAANSHALTLEVVNSVPVQSTNWGPTPLTINQFDPNLGTLTQVEIYFGGNVDGTASAESRDAQAADVTLTISADLSLDLSILSVSDIVLLGIGDSNTYSLTAFDTVIDFSGTSGIDGVSLSGVGNGSRTTTDANDLALFTGLSTLSFDSTAQGLSTGSGAGNLITQFATNAGSELSVTYTYTSSVTSVPEPGSLALMGLGLVGMIGAARARKKA